MQIRNSRKDINMTVLVKNIHGTADYSPVGCNSWKDYWEAKSGKHWPFFCAVSGCTERAEVGGHVKFAGNHDNRWFIVPLCYHHNNCHDAEFSVDYSLLVPVND